MQFTKCDNIMRMEPEQNVGRDGEQGKVPQAAATVSSTHSGAGAGVGGD